MSLLGIGLKLRQLLTLLPKNLNEFSLDKAVQDSQILLIS